MMDGIRVSDFSIERIVSSQFGRPPVPVPEPEPYLRIPDRLDLELASISHPALFPDHVPVPGCLLSLEMQFGDACCPCACAFHHAALSRSCQSHGIYFIQNPAEPGVQQLGGHRGQQQVRSCQKTRMRTVFTAGQTQQLEALLNITDYPNLQDRAELARGTGLSEDTVRVWFKNRRARRKRQRRGSKVRSGPSALLRVRISPLIRPNWGSDHRTIQIWLSSTSAAQLEICR
uniref:Homeobox protein Dharma n=1 Tax=Nothobranchius korthausae TaxID=1143690 RepID=A0A2Z5SR03_9TELE|nr:homeobox protein Dharma [Nothobranchius korthausae]